MRLNQNFEFVLQQTYTSGCARVSYLLATFRATRQQDLRSKTASKLRNVGESRSAVPSRIRYECAEPDLPDGQKLLNINHETIPKTQST